jgi:copper chaperone CopZ
MEHTYHIEGMTCSSCESKVKAALLGLEQVTKVETSVSNQTIHVSMVTHVPIEKLQVTLPEKYKISAKNHNETLEKTRSWFETYKPVLLIFMYILVITVLIQLPQNNFDLMIWMQHFMAGFFLVFSFFKLLNLKGFAESYKMYDVIAKVFPVWGYMYAFIELGLGLAYLVNFRPELVNISTFLVMSVSLVGVLQSLLSKKQIRCACLGAVFNLPMSTITIVEDSLMIIMSGLMIIYHF